MGTKHARTGLVVLSQKAKVYQFDRLLAHYPLHGPVPELIVPSKVVIGISGPMQDSPVLIGKAERAKSWKDE